MRSLAVLALLICATVSSGGVFEVGYVNEQGYTFGDDQYWHKNSETYTRTWVPGAAYYSYGCYRSTPGYYTYQTVATVPSYADPGWRGKLLELADNRNKYELRALKEQIEHRNYMEAITALGLQQNGRPYGYLGQTGNYASSYSNYGYGAVNASTVYGYSSIASTYDVNLDQLYQMANQLALNSQAVGSQATTEFQTLVGQAGESKSKVAEILARGEAAQRVLASLIGSSVETKQFTFSISPQGQIVPHSENVPLETKRDLYQRWSALAQAKCAACHAGAVKKGNFDVGVYPSLDPNARSRVLARLTSTDEAKRMPRADGGKSDGKPLSADELRLFVLVEPLSKSVP